MIKKLVATALLSVTAVMLSNRGCSADNTDLLKDWQVTISTQSFKPYLDYPKSPFGKLIKASVKYSQPAKGPETLYEDIYYTSSRVLGARMSNGLNVSGGSAGVIRVSCAAADESYGAANAVARVYLQLFLQRCPIRAIVIPKYCYNTIVSAMCNQGFRTAPSIAERRSLGMEYVFLITVISDPPGQIQEIIM